MWPPPPPQSAGRQRTRFAVLPLEAIQYSDVTAWFLWLAVAVSLSVAARWVFAGFHHAPAPIRARKTRKESRDRAAAILLGETDDHDHSTPAGNQSAVHRSGRIRPDRRARLR